jgi:polysaccharide chain length determinant protein (PEP-CTERM system associated)
MKSFRTRPDFSALSIVRGLWIRRWWILATWSLGSAATVAVVASLEPGYTANAIVQVESQKIPEAFVTATVQTTLEARLDRLKQQVLSRDRLWNLVETLNLYSKQREALTKEEVLRIMREDLGINLVRGWNAHGPGAFEVAYQAPNAKLAADVANRVAMFFINENLRQRTGEAEGTLDFLTQQLAEAEQRLRQNEAVLKEFKLTHNGELPQQEGALLASTSQSRAELLGIQEALGRAQQNKLILEGSASYAQELLRERQRALRARAAIPPGPLAAVAARGPIPPAASELELARQELKQLRNRYYDGHPEVQRVMQRVELLEREEAQHRRGPEARADRTEPPGAAAAPAAEEGAGSPEQAVAAGEDSLGAEARRLEELRAQISLISREITTLENRQVRVLQEIADTQSRIRAIPVREQQLAAITRDYETCKSNYDALLNKKLAADVAANMERWQQSQKFVMLDPARIPQRPTRPKRILLIPAGSLLSLGGALAAAFALQLRKNVLLGEWELPAGTVVVSRIPRLNAAARI